MFPAVVERSLGAGISRGNLTVLGSWNQPAFHYSCLGRGSAETRSGAINSINSPRSGGPCYWVRRSSQSCTPGARRESITLGDSHGIRSIWNGMGDRLAIGGADADPDWQPGRQFFDPHERIASTQGSPAYGFRTLHRRAKL